MTAGALAEAGRRPWGVVPIDDLLDSLLRWASTRANIIRMVRRKNKENDHGGVGS